jgi:hypothetical protein
MRRMQQEKNFSWLLIALLGYLIIVPVAADLGIMSARVMRAVMFSWLLACGVWSLRGFGGFFAAGIGLAIAGIVLAVLAANLESTAYQYASFAATAGFVLVMVWCVALQVLKSNEISTNRVIGTISLYLLFGSLWAVAYAVLEMLIPGSFSGFAQPLSHGWSTEWLYFSFVTMTTLGYGDLAPLSATARTLAYMQAVFGQFYIAILVAGLVSAYITERQRA